MKTLDLDRSNRNGQLRGIEIRFAITPLRRFKPSTLPATKSGFRINCFRPLLLSEGCLWLCAAILMCVFMSAFSSLARAQLYSGSITGVVTDQSAAVVPGAKV